MTTTMTTSTGMTSTGMNSTGTSAGQESAQGPIIGMHVPVCQWLCILIIHTYGTKVESKMLDFK